MITGAIFIFSLIQIQTGCDEKAELQATKDAIKLAETNSPQKSATSPTSSDAQTSAPNKTPEHIDWEPDLTRAQAKAKEFKRPIFLLFTGSSWCTPCKQLEKQILRDPVFILETKDDFIFVKYDLPLAGYSSEEIKDDPKKRDAIKRRDEFKIDHWPQIFLVDENGQTFGTAKYIAFSVEEAEKFKKEPPEFAKDRPNYVAEELEKDRELFIAQLKSQVDNHKKFAASDAQVEIKMTTSQIK